MKSREIGRSNRQSLRAEEVCSLGYTLLGWTLLILRSVYRQRRSRGEDMGGNIHSSRTMVVVLWLWDPKVIAYMKRYAGTWIHSPANTRMSLMVLQATPLTDMCVVRKAALTSLRAHHYPPIVA